jgi:hypothetical protein
MNKRAQSRIESIMGEAFDRAATILEAEFRKLLDAKPERYSRFVLAVGWGPTLFDASGKIIEGERCCAWGRRLLIYSGEFYDRYGADNRQVLPTFTQERQAA